MIPLPTNKSGNYMDRLEFKDFSTAVEEQFNKMASDHNMTLVRVAVDNDKLYELYLNSYPSDVNKLFRERRSYDCNCCRNFIRRLGGVIAINNSNLSVTSVWDVTVPGYFQGVADILAEFVKTSRIDNLYETSENIAGSIANFDNYDTSIKWNHFYAKVPQRLVKTNDSIGSALGEHIANKEVFASSLKVISLDSANTILELITQNSLYRGVENKKAVQSFVKSKKKYDSLTPEDQLKFLWTESKKLGMSGRIKNTAIGTLLVDYTESCDIEKSVASYENKVSGTNYKRTTSLVTPAMVKQAQEKLQSLGYIDSLERRLATKNDVSVNDVLFTSVHQKAMNVFDDIIDDTKRKVTKELKDVESISVDHFLKNVLPNAQKVEVLFESRLKSNLMAITAPVHATSNNMMKWTNQLAWSYNGDTTDAIKERVKKAGGNVDGYFRASLSWHNSDDLDLAIIDPRNERIYFGNKRSTKGGQLDIDANGGRVTDEQNPVENIYYTDKKMLEIGTYEIKVNNFNRRSSSSNEHELQIEFNGQLHTYAYPTTLRNSQNVSIKVHYDGTNITIDPSSGYSTVASSGEDVWNIKSGEFHPVTMMINSPNHWNENKVGNKHLFFLLDKCNPTEDIRGFYNEYLKPELNDIRKTIEVLGSRTKIVPSDNTDSLSGIGFSDTVRNDVTVRVSGKTVRTFKVLM